MSEGSIQGAGKEALPPPSAAAPSPSVKSILGAFALLGTSTGVTLLIGVAAVKAYAVLLGPGGMGVLSVFQSVISVSAIAAGLGVQVGIIQLGSEPAASGDWTRFSALRQAAWITLAATAVPLGIALLILRRPVAQGAFGNQAYAEGLGYIGIAVVFNLGYLLQVGIINARRRLGTIAGVSVAAAVITAGCTLASIRTAGVRGLPVGLLAGAVLNLLMVSAVRGADSAPAQPPPSRPAVRAALRDLLTFGLPYTASMLVGTGVQYLIPFIVLRFQDETGVGWYRATTLISTGYLSTMAQAMSRDYYPRLCAAGNRREDLVALANSQNYVLLLVGVPLILSLLALVEFVVPVLYSKAFLSAAGILKWYLMGETLRLSCWSLAYVILARNRKYTFFLIELLGGATMLATSLLFLRSFGLNGLGMAFLVTSVVYYLAAWVILRKDLDFRWDGANRRLFVFALAAVLAIRSCDLLKSEVQARVAAAAVAALVGVGCGTVLLKRLRRTRAKTAEDVAL